MGKYYKAIIFLFFLYGSTAAFALSPAILNMLSAGGGGTACNTLIASSTDTTNGWWIGYTDRGLAGIQIDATSNKAVCKFVLNNVDDVGDPGALYLKVSIYDTASDIPNSLKATSNECYDLDTDFESTSFEFTFTPTIVNQTDVIVASLHTNADCSSAVQENGSNYVTSKLSVADEDSGWSHAYRCNAALDTVTEFASGDVSYESYE